MEEQEPQPTDVTNFRKWAAIFVGVAAIGYMAYAVFRGIDETSVQLASFAWGLYIPVLLLTLVNYSLRFVKWHYLLGRLGIHMPVIANAWIFTAGLAMVITPGKAGELLKPYMVKVVAGAPMERTIPALVTERVMDGIAVTLLAAIGVGSFYADGVQVVVTALLITVAGLAVLAIKPLSLSIIQLIRKLPVVGGIGDRLETAYLALRTCLAPRSFVFTLVLSLIAWFAECVGYYLVLLGLQVGATLDVSTFLYAFATVFGAPSPGGMGMSDVALVEGSLALVDGMAGGQAVAAALLIRIATLWLGVLLGAFALFRLDGVTKDASQSSAAE